MIIHSLSASNWISQISYFLLFFHWGVYAGVHSFHSHCDIMAGVNGSTKKKRLEGESLIPLYDRRKMHFIKNCLSKSYGLMRFQQAFHVLKLLRQLRQLSAMILAGKHDNYW